MKKIAIITLYHNNYNYGGVLQACALQKVVQKLGCTCDIIRFDRSHSLSYASNHRNTGFESLKIHEIFFKAGNKIIRKVGNRLIQKDLHRKKEKYKEFDKHIGSTEKVYTGDTIADILPYYDIFICGSDQVWSPVSGCDECFLSFVPDGKHKISYAASIGADQVSKEYAEYMAPFLRRIDSISVREVSAAKIVNEILGEEKAVVTLDPTLLVSDIWSRMQKPIDFLRDKEFILLYFLGEDSVEWRKAYKFAKKQNKKIVSISYNKMLFVFRDYFHKDISVCDVGPAEFLWLIQNANCVLTDSFHGTVFSILFHKKFCVFERKSENANGSMNGRIESLLEMAGLQTQAVLVNKKIDSIIGHHIDYTSVEKRLDKYREDSRQYLKGAIYEEDIWQ